MVQSCSIFVHAIVSITGGVNLFPFFLSPKRQMDVLQENVMHELLRNHLYPTQDERESIRTELMVALRPYAGRNATIHIMARYLFDIPIVQRYMTRHNLNVTDIHGFTPLHCAINYARRKTVKVLIECKADPNAVVSRTNETCLDLAYGSDTSMLQFLLKPPFAAVFQWQIRFASRNNEPCYGTDPNISQTVLKKHHNAYVQQGRSFYTGVIEALSLWFIPPLVDMIWKYCIREPDVPGVAHRHVA